MMRVRRRLVRLVLALAFVLGALPAAHAQSAAAPTASDEVTSLAPPPLPPFPAAVPALTPPPEAVQLAGLPIVAVAVVVDDARWPDVRAPAISTLRSGDVVSPALARRAMSEALSSGFFADARVVFTREGKGVRAVVHVMPRKVVDAVRVDMHGAPVDGDQLLRDAELVNDAELPARDVAVYSARLEALMQRHGYPAPRIDISTRPTGDPLRVLVLVDIDAGAPLKIERRVLYPVRGTPEALAEAEKLYAVCAFARADQAALAAADADLEARIRAKGNPHASVSHDVVLHKGFVVLRVRVDFGMRIETRYEGNDNYDASTLDDVLDLAVETDRTPNHLVQKIRDFYVKHGFLDAEVRVEQRASPDAAVGYLVFHVVEHDPVRVAAREYPCLREQDIKTLSEGGPISAKAIGSEIDSFLDEELPGGEIFVAPSPDGVDAVTAGPLASRGARPAPLELAPDTVYAPETYERAVQHVQELYRSEGFLSAQVGPVQVMRRRCDPRSKPGECRPMKIPAPPDVCTYDATGVPLPVPPLEPGSTCEPDPRHDVTCEPRVWLRIPMKLGPRTQLYDIAFTGADAISPSRLAKIADVKLGSYVSTVKLEEARRRVADAYKEEGYTFVDVKFSLEPSPDRTRARVRFIVTEGVQVVVRDIVIKGNVHTRSDVIARRIALQVGQPYRASLVRKTEERIATLGTFANVSVELDDPYVPTRNKVVVVTVVELARQYTEIAPGFSTGEGFRLAAEYGHRNLWGNAIRLVLRLQLAYLPTPFIIDPTARENYRNLNGLARIGVRATGSMLFPEIGLGPLVRSGIDTILVHDLQRDFYITKLAAIPNISYRPVTELQNTVFQSFEFNNSRIFQSTTAEEYLKTVAASSPGGQAPADLVRQLLVPDGKSYAFAQRLLVTWDRRDDAFNARRGTYVASSIEHVDAYPIVDSELRATEATTPVPRLKSHFLKLIQTFAGYIPLPKGLRIASMTRVGVNIQLASGSQTYLDRLFFFGGVDTMRGWTLNSFIPQDKLDQIFAQRDLPDAVPGPNGTLVANPGKLTPATLPIRGGDLMMNERLELRIPIRSPFETVLFADMGNLWTDATYPFDHISFPIRAAVGSGIRVETPVGPLAIDYGINVTRRAAYEDFGALNFAIGLF